MSAIHGTPVAWYNPSTGNSFPVDAISIAAGPNLVYYAAVYINSGTIGVDTLTRGAQSANRVGSPLVQGSQRLELWRIIAPATGSAGPTVALSGSVGAAECQVIQWVANNADQATPNGALFTNIGTYSTGDTLDVVSTSPNDLVIEVMGWKNVTSAPPSITLGSGQASLGSGGFYFGMSASVKAGADGTVSMSELFHPTSAIAADFAHLAFNIKHNASLAASGDASGTATLDGPTVSGGASSTPPSTASGTVDLDSPTVSGGAGVGSGTITITLRVDGNLLAPGEVVPVVKVERLDGSVAVAASSRTSNGSGQIAIASTALLPGTNYIVTGWNADGSLRFIDRLQAT